MPNSIYACILPHGCWKSHERACKHQIFMERHSKGEFNALINKLKFLNHKWFYMTLEMLKNLLFFHELVNIFIVIVYITVKNIDFLCWVHKKKFFSLFPLPNFSFKNTSQNIFCEGWRKLTKANACWGGSHVSQMRMNKGKGSKIGNFKQTYFLNALELKRTFMEQSNWT